MPKVTLLADTWQNHLLIFGKAQYNFFGKKPQEVPVNIALICRDKKKSTGEPLFAVSELPEVVEIKQNVVIGEARQLTQLPLIEASYVNS
jgi:hypothetical protein